MPITRRETEPHTPQLPANSVSGVSEAPVAPPGVLIIWFRADREGMAVYRQQVLRSARAATATLGFDPRSQPTSKRELELTRHVSLRQLDPLALLALRTTGSCTVTVPEWLYDRDCPG